MNNMQKKMDAIRQENNKLKEQSKEDRPEDGADKKWRRGDGAEHNIWKRGQGYG